MNKKIFAMAVALCVVLPLMIGAVRTANAATPATLNLQSTFGFTLVPPADIGHTITVKLHVYNATNLWSWKIQLAWDPAFLNMTADPTEGSFLANGSGFFIWTPYAKTSGTLNEISDTRLTNDTVTGNGDLATFTFTLLQHGANATAFTLINMTSTVIQDNIGNQLTYSTTSAQVTATIPGDINHDGKVSLADLVILAVAYGSTPSSPKWNPYADLSGNGKVDLADLVTLATHYGKHL